MDTIDLLEQAKVRISQRKLYDYLPYGHPDTLFPDGKRWQKYSKEKGWVEWSNKPWQLDFHNGGADHVERMARTANRNGKTLIAASEVAIHMTGKYPDWWKGKRFNHPVLVWTGSPTNETSRDIVQTELLGGTDKESLGTGTIPKEFLIGRPKSRQAGVSDVADTFSVRHVSGGVSKCILKTFEQGWRKWQGSKPHIVWMDEEPEDNEQQGKIYSEARTRIITTNGILMVTFTPLLGNTDLVVRFSDDTSGKRLLINASWDDVPHLTSDAKKEAIASYDSHEIEARTRGVPILGQGRIFDIPEEDIKVFPFTIPSHFAQIKGIDFGIDHPAATADIAWDRDKDIIYLTRSFKKKDMDAPTHVLQINEVNPWVPVAWPHDGGNREKGSGKKLKSFYVGAKLLGMSACYDKDKKGSQPVEPIVKEVNERCMTGRFKAFSTCTEFWDEYRNYHRKDGRIVAKRDDILKSVFYAVMMRRYARPNMITRTQTSQPALISMRI